MTHKSRDRILTQPDMSGTMGNISSIAARVSNIENAWPAMAHRVTACEVADGSLSNRVGSLETSYGSLAQRMTAVESTASEFPAWKAAKVAALGKIDGNANPLVSLSILVVGISVSRASIEARINAIEAKINQHDDMFKTRHLTQ